MCIHTFTSKEARREYLTPPEKRDPPEKRLTEKEWASFGNATKATCLQEWLGDEEFFFCNWYAESPDAILEQLDILGHTSLVITACYEMEDLHLRFVIQMSLGIILIMFINTMRITPIDLSLIHI